MKVRLYLAIVVVVVFLEEGLHSLQEQQAVKLMLLIQMNLNNHQDRIDTQQCSIHHRSSNRLKHLLDQKNRSGSSNLPSQYVGTPSGMIQPSGTSGLAPVVQINVGIMVAPVDSDEQSPRSY